jgi:hypothetical protein
VFASILQRFLHDTVQDNFDFRGESRYRIRFKMNRIGHCIPVAANIFVECGYQSLFFKFSRTEIGDKAPYFA